MLLLTVLSLASAAVSLLALRQSRRMRDERFGALVIAAMTIEEERAMRILLDLYKTIVMAHGCDMPDLVEEGKHYSCPSCGATWQAKPIDVQWDEDDFGTYCHTKQAWKLVGHVRIAQMISKHIEDLDDDE